MAKKKRKSMALYLISYDIAEKDKDEYEPLWAFLRKMDATRILYSEWIVNSEVGQAVNIYDEMKGLIRSSDRLLVQEIMLDSAWDRLMISDDAFRAIVQRYARR
jgi:hypothetical protein